jgi:uncharacterized protein (TIGR02186 family)
LQYFNNSIESEEKVETGFGIISCCDHCAPFVKEAKSAHLSVKVPVKTVLSPSLTLYQGRGREMKKPKIQKSKIKSTVFLVTAFFLVSFAFRAAFADLMVKTDPADILIDFFYHGSTVSVRGEADPKTDLVIKITSPEGHQLLKEKGKVAGVLWMNVGHLKFEQTPNFYEVFSTKKLEEILSREELEKNVIGYPALEKHIEITPVANEEEKAKWFDEFVKFKETAKMYVTSYGKIEITTKADGRQEYYLSVGWPYQAQPGDYLVSVYAVRDKKVIDQAQSKVNVEQVGIVKTLATMANKNPAIYGLLSIGVALAAGFGVSMVFRKGGGSH